jgi:hypothetical protein
MDSGKGLKKEFVVKPETWKEPDPPDKPDNPGRVFIDERKREALRKLELTRSPP